MFSSVTKRRVEAQDLGAAYWVQNMLQPVQFLGAVSALLVPSDARSKRQKKPHVQCLVEIGPHAVLQGPLNQILIGISDDYKKAVTYLSVLRRGKNALRTALQSVGQLWCDGHSVKLGFVNTVRNEEERHKVLTDLPPYPWNHERSHWHESRLNYYRRFPPGPRTDLLGYPMDGFNATANEQRWSNILKPSEIPWVMDHFIGGQIILPGSAILAMVIEACQKVLDSTKIVEGFEFREVNFTRAMIFQTPDHAIEIALQLRPHFLGTRTRTYVWQRFSLISIAKDNSSVEHSSGLVQIRYAPKSSEVENGMEEELSIQKYKEEYAEIMAQTTGTIDTTVLYHDINELGMQFGPLFRLLSDMEGGNNVGCATLTIPDTAAVMPEKFEYPLLIHPTVLDGVFQMVFSRVLCSEGKVGMTVIGSIGSLYVSADLPNTPGTALRGYQTSHQSGPRQVLANLVVSDLEFSKPYIIIKDIANTTINSDDSKAAQSGTMLCTHMEWKEDITFLQQEATQVLCADPLPTEKMQHDHRLLDQAASIYMKKAIGSTRSRTTVDEQCCLREQWLGSQLDAETLSSVNSTESEDQILLAASEASPGGKLMQIIGENLPKIVSGDVGAEKIIRELGEPQVQQLNGEFLAAHHLNTALSDWLYLAGFKNADLRILEFPSRSTTTALSILSKLSGKDGEGPRYAEYTLAQSSSSTVNAAKALLKRFPNARVSALESLKEQSKQSSDASKYDAVIIPDILCPGIDFDMALEYAKSVLTAGGKLYVGSMPIRTVVAKLFFGFTDSVEWWKQRSEVAIPKNDPHHEYQTRTLLKHGFSSPKCILSEPHTIGTSDGSRASLIVSSVERKPRIENQDVVIILPENPSNLLEVLVNNLEQALSSASLNYSRASLTTVSDPTDKIYFSLIEIETSILHAPSEETYESLKKILLRSAGIIWVTRGVFIGDAPMPARAVAIGLFRTLRAELPQLSLFNFDLSSDLDITSNTASSLLLSLFRECFDRTSGKRVIDHEYAESNGTIYIPRLVQDTNMNSSLDSRDKEPTPIMDKLYQGDRPLKMRLGEAGLFDTFRFEDRLEYEQPLLPDRVDIELIATGLNFVDVMAALGYVPNPALGAEFAGRITTIGSNVPKGAFHIGQIVAGLSEDCFATNIRVHWRTIQPVPEGMTPESAATCVIAYCTAYFALYDNGRLKKGDTILIHSAAGGLGQAAVQLALHVGAIVYATVGSTYKKELLMERYGIPENHIFTSRDTTFARGVMRETKGRGVDVVLNSTYGEMLRQSWLCVADFGIFVEVGKRDILSNNMLEMSPFIRGCTYSAFNLAQYTEDCEPHRLQACAEVLRKVFELLGSGYVTPPFPLTVMKISQAEEAFRGLQSGKFAGKIVITYNQEDIVPVLPKKKLSLEVNPKGTYLLAGGLGGIGRSLADLLVKHGAKHVAFLSRSGDTKDEIKIYLEKLRGKMIQASAYPCDITNHEALKSTLRQISTTMPEIKGFVHCAMLLKDSVFENMSHEHWTAASAPKIQGSWNMHELLPKNLDFFVMLSSTSGIIGNPGQANYAAGNTFQNALAHHRRSKGMNATAIDLSAVAGIGHLAENAGHYDMRNPAMKMQIGEKEIHHIFLAAIAGNLHEKPVPSQITTGIIGGEVLRNLMDSASWARDSKFMLLRKADGLSSSANGSQDPTREAFIGAESLVEAAAVVETALVNRLAKALFISPEDINIEQPLHAFGVDSLIAVEIRNWILKELKSEISILDILSPLPIHSLTMKISELSKILPAKLRLEASKKKLEQEPGTNDEEDKTGEVGSKVIETASMVQGGIDLTRVADVSI